MSFTEPEVSEFEDEEESPKSLRQRLGREAAENQRLKEQLAQRDRDLAFTKVGLPPTPMASFFMENYKGEASEESIRTAAAELGLIGSPTQEATSQVDAIDQMSDVAAGAVMTMPADQMAQMDAEMRQVPPGPRYGEQIELILQRYGRPTRLDET